MKRSKTSAGLLMFRTKERKLEVLLVYFIPYLYLFICLIVHCRRQRGVNMIIPGGRFGAVLAGISGAAITLFAMVVALFPPAGTTQVWLHELKLGGGAALLVSVGLVIYWRARRRRHAHP